MLSIQEITQSLPPVRDDEPPSLRQAIADEILDHLQCGLRRELLLNGGDEQAARHRVLDKFGDPRQIARQLWYQAMWSKIMAQRIILFMASLSLLVSIALAAMMGWIIHQVAQNNAVSQAQNALLLERIANLVTAPTKPEPVRDPDENNLKIKVTLGNKDGPPAEGFSINVSRLPRIGDANSVGTTSTHQAKIGKLGIEDCGFVGPGRYQVRISAPWGEYSQQSFAIFSGRDHVEQCIVPEKCPDSTKVSLKIVGLPEGNTDAGTALVCIIKPTGSRVVAEHEWLPQYTGWGGNIRTPSLIYVPGEGLWVTDSRYMLVWGADAGTNVRNSSWEPCPLPVEYELPEHEYSVHFQIVKLLEKQFQQQSWKDRLTTSDPQTQNAFQAPDKFVVAPGQQNEWTISIPDVVVKCIKEGTFLPPNSGGMGAGMGGMGGGFF